jgi:NAD+ diphosphatase
MAQTFYATSKINRHGDYRSNPPMLKKIMIDLKTRFVPTYKGKNLFKKINSNFEALILNNQELKIILPNNIINPIFLGVANNISYVGFNIDQSHLDIDLWCEENSIIIDDLRKYGATLNEIDASFLALTSGMFFWQNTHKFCGSCGHSNISTDPAIITLISSGDRILLGRSPRFPEGMYSTLAGFVEPGESLEQALEREVFEEVGIKVKNIKYFDSQPWPFPASLMLGFFAEAKHEDMKIDYDEIEDAHWFSIEELKSLQHPSIKGGFKLPRVDSIARRLVNTWMTKF